ncbi:MAG: DUF308 domain-containing protein [Lachnospiraceae bacterium]|nr:DUF308 domain-containing protein [Lachnospiraceae bacterium]MCI7189803.1 DUF308 domain-containing protein [Lachnospiraceae bacterium]MDD7628808.1 DUF308 domain-containing protein [Lachnospiraceae bacterium]MDY4120302.1 DUF308 domain-containing protein [Lachnospiraceae bacterium]
MANFLKNLKANYTLSAIICVVIGVVLIIWPGTSTQVVCMVLGGMLMIYGIVQIILYLFARERTLYLQGMLILGIVFSVVGAWILLKPETIIAAVPIIMGIIIIMHGLHNAIQAIDLKKMDYENWWVALLFGILTIVLGVVLVCNPFGAVEIVVRVIGAFLIYDGISDMWILSRLFKTKKNAERIIDAEATVIDEDK